MNPFQRLGVKISNWWRGEPQDSGGVAELEKRNSAATQAEEQRIEAEKREILDDLYLYGM